MRPVGGDFDGIVTIFVGTVKGTGDHRARTNAITKNRLCDADDRQLWRETGRFNCL